MSKRDDMPPLNKRLPKVDLDALNEKGVEIKNAQGAKKRVILCAAQGSQLPETLLAVMPKPKKIRKAEKRMTVRLSEEMKTQLVSKSMNGVSTICEFLRAKVRECVQNDSFFAEILPRVEQIAKSRRPQRKGVVIAEYAQNSRLDFRLDEETARLFAQLCERHGQTMQTVLWFLLHDKLKRFQALTA